MKRALSISLATLIIAVRVGSADLELPPQLAVDANGNRIGAIEARPSTVPEDFEPNGPEIIHVAARDDALPGSGLNADPYNAGISSGEREEDAAEKFDQLFERLRTSCPNTPLVIDLGPGVFYTRARDGFGRQHLLKANWTLQGAGMYATEIRNINPHPAGVTMFNSSGGTWGGAEEGNITIRDLTLNPQKSVFHDPTIYGGIEIHGDGITATGHKTAHGWATGTQISIDGATVEGLDGAAVITSVTENTFSWENTTKATATANVRRTGQWTALRDNGGDLRGERIRAINCGSSNHRIECWPLWHGSGSHNLFEGCVVEQCSGWVSAIACFPGKYSVARNCRVDGTGAVVLGIWAETVKFCSITNPNYGIYSDTMAFDTGTTIVGNVIEGPAGGGIFIRPSNHHKNVVITGNVVRGGTGMIGIGIEPMWKWNGTDWINETGEKIWIEGAVIAGNDVGEKGILAKQTRGGIIAGNTAGVGAVERNGPMTYAFNRRPDGTPTPTLQPGPKASASLPPDELAEPDQQRTP